MDTQQDLWTKQEVADHFRVSPRTIEAWARAGKFGDAIVKTLGGHNRFRRSEILALTDNNGGLKIITGSNQP
jgi:hypothetical protein